MTSKLTHLKSENAELKRVVESQAANIALLGSAAQATSDVLNRLADQNLAQQEQDRKLSARLYSIEKDNEKVMGYLNDPVPTSVGELLNASRTGETNFIESASFPIKSIP